MSLFYNKTLREISIRTWSIYLADGKPNKHVFGFTPSVGVEHFWMDLDGRHVLRTPSVGAAGVYVGGVYVILILRA